MSKQLWKPGNMLYPLPAVMVSTAGQGRKQQYSYYCMDRNSMYESCHGIYIGKTGTLVLPHD